MANPKPDNRDGSFPGREAVEVGGPYCLGESTLCGAT